MAHLLNDLGDPGGAIVLVWGARERYWSPSRWCAGGRMYWEQFRTTYFFLILIFLVVCFTSSFVFSIAVLPHSPGVVYYHLLLRRETRIPGVSPFSFRTGIWDLFAIGDRNPIHPQPL